MQIILYASVALIAIAFSILVIYVIQTLKSLQATMVSVSKTLDGLEVQLDGVTKETTLLLQKTNTLADDIQSKSENLNTVVDAVKNVGQTVQTFNHSLQGVSQSVTKEIEKNEEKIAQIAQVGTILFEFRDKWKERKKRKAEQQSGMVATNRVDEQEKHRLKSFS